MTAIVGIKCKDGVVIGTDSSATFVAAGGRVHTIEQPCEKLHIVGDHVIYAGTGQVGMGQRFVDVLQDGWNKKWFGSDKDPLWVVETIANAAVNRFEATGARFYNQGILEKN